MLRRSILEQALKIFLSEKIYGGRHQQFIAAKMSKEQYGEYLQQQQEISVTVEPEDITAIAAILDNFSHRTKVLIQRTQTYFLNSKPLRCIIAEDVFKPLIDFDAYNCVLTRMFGPINGVSADRNPAVRKGGLDLSNCVNPEVVFSNPRLFASENAYREMIKDLTNVSSSCSAEDSKTVMSGR